MLLGPRTEKKGLVSLFSLTETDLPGVPVWAGGRFCVSSPLSQLVVMARCFGLLPASFASGRSSCGVVQRTWNGLLRNVPSRAGLTYLPAGSSAWGSLKSQQHAQVHENLLQNPVAASHVAAATAAAGAAAAAMAGHIRQIYSQGSTDGPYGSCLQYQHLVSRHHMHNIYDMCHDMSIAGCHDISGGCVVLLTLRLSYTHARMQF